MRILVDLRCLETASATRGFGRYARELVRALPRELPGGWSLLGLCRGGSPIVEGVEPVRYAGPKQGVGYADRILLPPLFRRFGVDLYHSPAYALPGRRGGRGPALVLTVHDLVADLRPSALGLRHRLAFRRTFRSARTAERVIAVSRTTREELIRLYRLAPERVVAVPNGVAPAFRSVSAGSPTASGFPRPFLLYVGGFDALKNVPFLIEVLAILRSRGEAARLVAVGGDPDGSERLRSRAEALGLGDALVLAGTVDDGRLAVAYREAEAFLFPSLYEGFGLPPLEAMASGCPVVSSPGGALRENLDAAALLVEPSDPVAWADAIVLLRRDALLRQRLADAGRERAGSFTWERTARATLEVYQSALEETRRA